MIRWGVALLVWGLALSAHAEVYTWTDAGGGRHYGDHPPAGVDARSVSLGDAPLSTIHDNGLRPDERDLLRQLNAAAAASAARQPPAEPPPPVIVERPYSPSPAVTSEYPLAAFCDSDRGRFGHTHHHAADRWYQTCTGRPRYRTFSRSPANRAFGRHLPAALSSGLPPQLPTGMPAQLSLPSRPGPRAPADRDRHRDD